MRGNPSINFGLFRGRYYAQEANSNEYVRDYTVYSFQFFIERLSINFLVDKYERFAFMGTDYEYPKGIFIGSGISNDDAARAIAEDYGLVVVLVD